MNMTIMVSFKINYHFAKVDDIYERKRKVKMQTAVTDLKLKSIIGGL